MISSIFNIHEQNIKINFGKICAVILIIALLMLNFGTYGGQLETRLLAENVASIKESLRLGRLEENKLRLRGRTKKRRRKKRRKRVRRKRKEITRLKELQGQMVIENDKRQREDRERSKYLAKGKNFWKEFAVMVLLCLVLLALQASVACSYEKSVLVLMGALPLAVGNPIATIDDLCNQNEQLESIDHIIRKRYKISIQAQIFLYQQLQENREIRSKELLLMAYERKIEISVSQLNRIRQEWGFSARRGRPGKQEEIKREEKQIITSVQANAGVKLFLQYLEDNDEYDIIVRAIQLAIDCYQEYCGEGDFRLLHSREQTIEKKFKALTVLSLLGIKRLSELDYHEHHLNSVLGYSYSYSTLAQFLGELERIDAGSVLNLVLSRQAQGEYCYVDPHKIAYYSRQKMNKGMITNKGKIQAGSCAVLAHDQYAQLIWLEYYPPDTHLSQVIESLCSKIVKFTGISQFIIDREVNSVKIAQLFIANGWELICLLGANEYKSLDCFNKHFSKQLADGTRIYKATWRQYRENDPRKFVIVQKQEKIIVYWLTPRLYKLITGEQALNSYCARTEIQENSIKDMKSHGDLDINYGRKTIVATDRTHQRKIDKIDKKIAKQHDKLQKSQQKIIDQNHKVTQSVFRNHPTLLHKRQNKLEQLQQKQLEIQTQIDVFEQQKKDLGPPVQRKDRDFRKQRIMTCRTAWLENQLKKFTSLLCANIEQPVDIETTLALFFNRSAIQIDTEKSIIYQFNTNGLSRKFKTILKGIIDGFNRIALSCNGKTVSAKLTEFV